MNCRRHVTVQLLLGNGTRVTGLSLSLRRLALAGALLVVAGVGAGLGLHRWLQGVAQATAVVTDQNRDQRTFIESMTREIASLRREVGSWRAMHTHILEAFGPAAGPAGASTGIGGAVASLPRARTSLTPSEELDALAVEIQEAGTSLRALKRLVTRASRALAALPSTWPVRGAVNSEFGTRVSPWSGATEFHSGIDIAGRPGTRIRAPAAGTVILAGAHHEYGLAVILDHGQEIRTVYAHLSKIHVSHGQQVARGAEIGLIGSTGRSSGPHLHYEVLVSGQTVNPRSFFWD